MRTAILFSLVAGSLAAAAPGAKDKDPPKPSPLVGEWEIVSVTTNGQTRDWEFGGIHVFTADGKWTTKFGRPNEQVVWKKYAADDKADPKTLDLLRGDEGGKDTTWRLLYQVDGDTLKICMQADDHTTRPAALEAKAGSKNMIQTLKRIKPKK